MKNLFEVATADEVKTRLGKLRKESERLWGKMTAPQMVAHCAISMRWAVGELVPDPAPLPVRMVGRVIKPFVFRNDDPIRKNAPTAKSLIISDERDLEWLFRRGDSSLGRSELLHFCGVGPEAFVNQCQRPAMSLRIVIAPHLLAPGGSHGGNQLRPPVEEGNRSGKFSRIARAIE